MESLVKVENLDFWHQKKVFITGHTGFKGSWLSILLNHLGSEVYGFALEPNTETSLFNESGLRTKINSFIGNILDKETLTEKVKEFQPEIVFHMAAQPLVRESYDQPILTLNTNIIGTANILEACRMSDSVYSFINITTDKCYLNEELGIPFVENDHLGGKDIYSASKASSEIITKAYRDSFFNGSKCKIATARAGNVIGGGDWSDNRLIPDIVKALNSNKDPEIRAPDSIRPWQHVLDPLFGYMNLAQKLYINKSYDEAWNFGPSEEDSITVKEMTTEFIKLWQLNKTIILNQNEKNPYESKTLKLDITKAKEKLNWQPIFSINETIKTTALWYKEFYKAKKDAYELCIADINKFLSKKI